MGSIAALCSAERGQEQSARRRLAQALRTGGTQVDITDIHGVTATFSGDDAKKFTLAAQREFDRHADTSNALNYWNPTYHLTFKLEGGSLVTVLIERRGPYYIEDVDEWYLGTREFGFLCVLVFASIRLEQGCNNDERDTLHARVTDAYNYMNIPAPTRWEAVGDEDVSLIAAWVRRYDSVSDQPSIDTEELLGDS